MHVVHCSAVPSFLERATPFLLAHEAHNNLLLGICAELARNPATFGSEPPVLLIAENDGAVVLAAVQTPPHNLILSHTEYTDALDLLASTLAAEAHPLPGVQGARAVAEHFASAGQHCTSSRSHR